MGTQGWDLTLTGKHLEYFTTLQMDDKRTTSVDDMGTPSTWIKTRKEIGVSNREKRGGYGN